MAWILFQNLAVNFGGAAQIAASAMLGGRLQKFSYFQNQPSRESTALLVPNDPKFVSALTSGEALQWGREFKESLKRNPGPDAKV